MCLVCATVAAPEVAVIVGGYAAMRFGRPVSRLRTALGRDQEREDAASSSAASEAAGSEPAGSDAARSSSGELESSGAGR